MSAAFFPVLEDRTVNMHSAVSGTSLAGAEQRLAAMAEQSVQLC